MTVIGRSIETHDMKTNDEKTDNKIQFLNNKIQFLNNKIQFLKIPAKKNVELEIEHDGNIYHADTSFLTKDTALCIAQDLIVLEWVQDVIVVYYDGEAEGMEYSVFRR